MCFILTQFHKMRDMSVIGWKELIGNYMVRVGLIGYGKLIIIKHNENFLSAYGHNRKILVKEGQVVKGQQKIAELGTTGANRAMLHFEIRYKGKPVDPMKYLPKL